MPTAIYPPRSNKKTRSGGATDVGQDTLPARLPADGVSALRSERDFKLNKPVAHGGCSSLRVFPHNKPPAHRHREGPWQTEVHSSSVPARPRLRRSNSRRRQRCASGGSKGKLRCVRRRAPRGTPQGGRESIRSQTGPPRPVRRGHSPISPDEARSRSPSTDRDPSEHFGLAARITRWRMNSDARR